MTTIMNWVIHHGIIMTSLITGIAFNKTRIICLHTYLDITSSPMWFHVQEKIICQKHLGVTPMSADTCPWLSYWSLKAMFCFIQIIHYIETIISERNPITSWLGKTQPKESSTSFLRRIEYISFDMFIIYFRAWFPCC